MKIKMKIMRLGFAVLICGLSLSTQARAQSQDYNEGIKQELNQDVEQLYPKRTKKSVKRVQQDVETESVSTERVQSVQVPVPAQQAQASQPIYILQQQQPTALPQAQQQPTTNVEAAAIHESKSEQLRKQREEVERQTEDKMVNRLEDDRLQSEKERSDRLFNPVAKPAPTPALVPAPTPVPYPEQQMPVYAAPLPVQKTTVVTPEPEVATITTSRDDVVPVQPQDEGAKFSVGALAGIGSYPSLDNVNGSYAAGVMGEMIFDDRMGIELSGIFSSYDLKNYIPNFFTPAFFAQSFLVTVNQFDLTAGLDYHILDGRVSPVVGVLAGYTRRSYTSRSNGFNNGFGNPSVSIPGSNAFNGGFLAGVDIKATKKLTIGCDFRYMMNLSFRTDNAFAYNSIPFDGTTPIEGSSYYFATINLKLSL